MNIGQLSNAPKRLFQSEFEGSTEVRYRDWGAPYLTGNDDGSGDEWAAFFRKLSLDPIEGGEHLDEFATTVEHRTGPDGTVSKVLQMYVRDGTRPGGDPSAPFRAEADWFSPPDAAYGKMWMNIRDTGDNADEWRVIQEWKGGERAYAADGNLINTWRANIATMERDGQIVWRLKIQDHRLDANGRRVDNVYVEEYSTVPVELNQWMMVESAYNKGTD
ncbi:MAG: hypothetical protein AAF264_02020, partial [Pseudomonadota bacterium]